MESSFIADYALEIEECLKADLFADIVLGEKGMIEESGSVLDENCDMERFGNLDEILGLEPAATNKPPQETKVSNTRVTRLSTKAIKPETGKAKTGTGMKVVTRQLPKPVAAAGKAKIQDTEKWVAAQGLVERKREAKCQNKNAVAARENRLKKKMYLFTIEKRLAEVKDANCVLRKKTDRQKRTLGSLQKQLETLEALVRVNPRISSMLGMAQKVSKPREEPKVVEHKPTNFMVVEDENAEPAVVPQDFGGVMLDHCYSGKSKTVDSVGGGGICLHVVDQNITLEFCSACAAKKVP